MTARPVNQTATINPVATSTASATLASAASSGAARIIDNSSSAILYVKFGTGTASSSDFSFAMVANTTWYAPDNAYAGPIQGILASGTGTARVTSY